MLSTSPHCIPMTTTPWHDQARDRLGRWVSQNKGTILTKAIQAGAGLAGGAMAGPPGAAAGQLLGSVVARPAIALGEAMMTGNDQAFHEELMAMGRNLNDGMKRAQDAMAGIDTEELESVMSKDMLGWAVAHVANAGINAAIPGADMIPGKGGAVAALTVGQLHKLKQQAKQKYKPAASTT